MMMIMRIGEFTSTRSRWPKNWTAARHQQLILFLFTFLITALLPPPLTKLLLLLLFLPRCFIFILGRWIHGSGGCKKGWFPVTREGLHNLSPINSQPQIFKSPSVNDRMVCNFPLCSCQLPYLALPHSSFYSGLDYSSDTCKAPTLFSHAMASHFNSI